MCDRAGPCHGESALQRTGTSLCSTEFQLEKPKVLQQQCDCLCACTKRRVAVKQDPNKHQALDEAMAADRAFQRALPLQEPERPSMVACGAVVQAGRAAVLSGSGQSGTAMLGGPPLDVPLVPAAPHRHRSRSRPFSAFKSCGCGAAGDTVERNRELLGAQWTARSRFFSASASASASNSNSASTNASTSTSTSNSNSDSNNAAMATASPLLASHPSLLRLSPVPRVLRAYGALEQRPGSGAGMASGAGAASGAGTASVAGRKGKRTSALADLVEEVRKGFAGVSKCFAAVNKRFDASDAQQAHTAKLLSSFMGRSSEEYLREVATNRISGAYGECVQLGPAATSVAIFMSKRLVPRSSGKDERVWERLVAFAQQEEVVRRTLSLVLRSLPAVAAHSSSSWAATAGHCANRLDKGLSSLSVPRVRDALRVLIALSNDPVAGSAKLDGIMGRSNGSSSSSDGSSSSSDGSSKDTVGSSTGSSCMPSVEGHAAASAPSGGARSHSSSALVRSNGNDSSLDVAARTAAGAGAGAEGTAGTTGTAKAVEAAGTAGTTGAEEAAATAGTAGAAGFTPSGRQRPALDQTSVWKLLVGMADLMEALSSGQQPAIRSVLERTDATGPFLLLLSSAALDFKSLGSAHLQLDLSGSIDVDMVNRVISVQAAEAKASSGAGTQVVRRARVLGGVALVAVGGNVAGLGGEEWQLHLSGAVFKPKDASDAPLEPPPKWHDGLLGRFKLLSVETVEGVLVYRVAP